MGNFAHPAFGLSAIRTSVMVSWIFVCNIIQEPYLDEVFHVGQAQQYCQGNFHVWDDKITTPPGLYLIAYVLSPVLGCSLTALRLAVSLCGLSLLHVLPETYRARGDLFYDRALHNGMNLMLFPPLIFFCALYYTDVPSTLSVVSFYLYFTHCYQSKAQSAFQVIGLVILGLLSLSFRQTNIFWVAIFPAGLVLVRELDKGHRVIRDSMHGHTEGFGDSIVAVARTSWKMEVVHNPIVHDACFEDYLKTIVSICACALKALMQPQRLLTISQALAPYIVLVTSFLAFVVWNGGVVLGDKSNHIASLHLPQMLYIWPFFTFFSWPLLYPYLLAIVAAVLDRLPRIPALDFVQLFRRRDLMPRLWLLVVGVLFACIVVRFNTIVHPFTLADNRHYTFYIFRILLRGWWVKYAVTPIYVLCGWACIQAMGTSKSKTTTPSNTNTDSDFEPIVKHDETTHTLPAGTSSATTSFVLIWLATTAAQLIPAPLFEPRYLILPWIFWRLHIPLRELESPTFDKISASRAPNEQDSDHERVVWHHPWLELLWFLFVNFATMGTFFSRTFEWPQEPGKKQRFMW